MINAVIVLAGLGVVAAAVLFVVARRFKVYEDPRIDDVSGMLPGANCGGCGFAGCRALAEKLVEADDLGGLFCPAGGAVLMEEIAKLLGKTAPEHAREVALVRCAGCREKRLRVNHWDGARSCAVEAMTYGGETGCFYGCLGEGDCVAACRFGAIKMLENGLPEVDADKCTACGACVGACPKALIELRKAGPKNRGVYVACRNTEKGAVAKKACSAACIACGKCAKVCEFDAIEIENNLAFIDSHECKLCRKCVAECPTGAIITAGWN